MAYRSMRKFYFEHKEPEAAREYERRMASSDCLPVGMALNGREAFVMLTPELRASLEELRRDNALLDSLYGGLSDTARSLFARQNLIDEIRQTNEIENVHSTRREIKATLDGIRRRETAARKRKLKFEGMARKYLKLLEDGGDVPCSCQAVRALYDELMLDEVTSEDDGNRPDGDLFRKGTVGVYDKNDQEIHAGVYPESEIIRCMEQALAFLNRSDADILVRTAVFHYLFTYIHPFYDGNGRMTRFISSSVLARALCPCAALRLACVIQTEKARYYKAFRETNDRRSFADLTDFVQLFVGFAAEAVTECLDRLSENRERYETCADAIRAFEPHARKREVLEALLSNALFDDEGLSVGGIVEATGISESTLRGYIKDLMKRTDGIAVETEGGRNIYRLDPEVFTKH